MQSAVYTAGGAQPQRQCRGGEEVMGKRVPLWIPESLGSDLIGCWLPLWLWQPSYLWQNLFKTLGSLGLARSLQVGRVTPSARDSTSDKERFLMRECVGSHLSEYLPDLAPGGQATFCPCQQALSIWPEPTSSHYCKLSVSSWVAVPPGLLWTVAASLQHKFYFAPDCELLPRTTLHPTYMLKVISFFKYKVYSTPNRGEDPKVQSLVQIQAWLQWIQQRLDIHRADNITCVSLSIRACVHLWLSTHLLGTKFISSNIMSGHSSPTFSTFLKDKKTKN